jgi:hypothetical protein
MCVRAHLKASQPAPVDGQGKLRRCPAHLHRQHSGPAGSSRHLRTAARPLPRLSAVSEQPRPPQPPGPSCCQTLPIIVSPALRCGEVWSWVLMARECSAAIPATASEGSGRGDGTATGGLITGQYRAGKRGHRCRVPAGGPGMERSTAEPEPAMAACGLTPALRIKVRDLCRLCRGDHGSFGAAAGSPAGTVDVSLVLGRRIGVNHQVYAVHLDTAGSDVSRATMARPDRTRTPPGSVCARPEPGCHEAPLSASPPWPARGRACSLRAWSW